MSTVQPSTPHTPKPPAGGLINTTALAVKILPQVLAQIQTLPLGQAIQATVTTQTVANHVQIMTALGPITLQTGMTLPKASILTLILTSLNPPAFQIGLVDGKAVPGANGPGPVKTAGQAALNAPLSSPEAPALQAGAKITAILLRPAPAAPQALPAPQSAPPTPSAEPASGTPSAPALPKSTPQMQAAARLSAANPQASQTAQVAPTTPPSKALPAAAASIAAQPFKPPQTAPITLPAGTRLTVTVQKIGSPPSVLTSPPSSAAKGIAQGQVVTGTVIGRTPLGQPIVQTPGATMAFETPAALADGTKITFRFDSAPLTPEPSTAAQRLSRAGEGLGLVNAKTWDDLGDALKTLAIADPARFHQVARTALPQPGAKLTHQLLFFLQALKGGNIKSLFGDTAARIIDKERPGLMKRLGTDFQVMSRLADEPQSGDWRLALIPLWSGQQLEQVRLYYKGGGAEETGDEPEGTRFVLDLDLSNLGRMQIDGLMKPTQKRLDLIVRTDHPLPAEMRAEIAKIAIAAQDQLGLTTIVSFQAKPAHFVEFPPDAPPEQGLIV